MYRILIILQFFLLVSAVFSNENQVLDLEYMIFRSQAKTPTSNIYSLVGSPKLRTKISSERENEATFSMNSAEMDLRLYSKVKLTPARNIELRQNLKVEEWQNAKKSVREVVQDMVVQPGNSIAWVSGDYLIQLRSTLSKEEEVF